MNERMYICTGTLVFALTCSATAAELLVPSQFPAIQFAIDAAVSGDGLLEIILSKVAPYDVSIFLSNGDGMLLPQNRYGVANRAHNALAGDFIGDGIVDIAAGSFGPIPP